VKIQQHLNLSPMSNNSAKDWPASQIYQYENFLLTIIQQCKVNKHMCHSKCLYFRICTITYKILMQYYKIWVYCCRKNIVCMVNRFLAESPIIFIYICFGYRKNRPIDTSTLVLEPCKWTVKLDKRLSNGRLNEPFCWPWVSIRIGRVRPSTFCSCV